MFVKIKGKTYGYQGSTYYEVMAIYKNEANDDYELCASYSTQALTGQYTGGNEELALECHAWGYDGLGPQLLACHILAYLADEGNSDIARKYYKEFTTEIIANLPDEFELTREQINRWLRKKQKQTKGKDNERTNTQT